MKPMLFLLLLVVAVCAQPADQQERKPLTRTEPERRAKAQELLNQARTALSSGTKLEAIQTLCASGKVRRLVSSAARTGGGSASVAIIGGDVEPSVYGADNLKEEFANGKIEYEFALPSKFRWQEDVQPFRRLGWLDSESFWLKNNDRPLVIPNPHFAEAFRQQLQAGFVYITLGLLLTPPPGLALEFNYVDEKPFRQGSAEVIAITGPGTFKAELYLDQKTHLPLLLCHVIGAAARPAMAFTPGGTSREEGLRAVEIARQQAAAKPPGPQEREKLWLFEDYRAVDGVLFPHKISTQINGKLIEEILFAKFKVNQPIQPEKFAEKK